MNKKISLGAAITFALIVAAAVFSVTMVYSRTETNKVLTGIEESKLMYEKFGEISDKVNQRYYGDINTEKIEDGFAKGYLEGLDDPYAKYYSAEEYAQYIEDTAEDRASIGVKTKPSADGYLEITNVSLDSPAYTVDIREGSYIVEINDKVVNEENNEQMAHKLQGEEGAKVTLVVRQDGEDKYHDLTMRILENQTIAWEILEDTEIGYMDISGFDSNTSNQFNRALKKMQEEGAKALIIDLRGTAETDLGTAPRVLDRLVPAGVLISTVSKNHDVQEIEFSDNNELSVPMAVLINGNTAGTAEIFAQVLTDYDKAKTVGTQSAGRGVMLDIMQLSDGSALEFTVGLYQSPSGVSFDGEGIEPDFDVDIPGVDDEDWDKLPVESDPQLIKAMEVVSTS